MNERTVRAGSVVGAVGAALTSVFAAICCIGPLALTLLGVNGMILAAGLKPYRFYLIGASGVMLALAYWMTYRPPRSLGGACSIGSGRFTRFVLGLATVLWIGSFVLQFFANQLWEIG